METESTKEEQENKLHQVWQIVRRIQRIWEQITPILFDGQSNWYLNIYKLGKMLANLPHHSATLHSYTTDRHTFNIHESITGIGKCMSWSGKDRGKEVDVMITERLGKVGGKYIWVCLCNISGQRLKTKERNIPECSRRFKHLAFLRLILSHDLAETRIRKKLCYFTSVSCSMN